MEPGFEPGSLALIVNDSATEPHGNSAFVYLHVGLPLLNHKLTKHRMVFYLSHYSLALLQCLDQSLATRRYLIDDE